MRIGPFRADRREMARASLYDTITQRNFLHYFFTPNGQILSWPTMCWCWLSCASFFIINIIYVSCAYYAGIVTVVPSAHSFFSIDVWADRCKHWSSCIVFMVCHSTPQWPKPNYYDSTSTSHVTKKSQFPFHSLRTPNHKNRWITFPASARES